MSNSKMVGGVSEQSGAPDWAGVLKEIVRQFCDGELTKDQGQLIIDRKNPFDPLLLGNYIDPIVDWQDFYREFFRIEFNLSGIVIPKKKKGFDRLLVLIPGMTLQRLLNRCKELFKVSVWIGGDLDKIVTSDRTADNGAYAIWVRDRVEADVELKNQSANDLKQKRVSGITLEERLIYELKYFEEIRKHLDIQNWTLCLGSRYGDGYVPIVSWNSIHGRLVVDWYGPGHALDSLRSREVSYEEELVVS